MGKKSERGSGETNIGGGGSLAYPRRGDRLAWQ